MNHSIAYIEKNLISIQGQKVLIDRDVAQLYGVETKRINEAVKNNLDKFPTDYLIELSKSEWNDLRSKFSTANFSKTRVTPKAFTEKGLYMLATILKSKQATQTTFLIIETFAKIRALQEAVSELSSPELPKGRKKNSLLKKSGELMADLLDHDLTEIESETTLELNFAVLKLKHTTKRKKE
ncbi:MAG: ORF6N domain-containing protein [Flavobacteriaceae bacterium]|nr:ORF6N domain-containing protein [Flavobacteriaceae bacterium]